MKKIVKIAAVAVIVAFGATMVYAGGQQEQGAAGGAAGSPAERASEPAAAEVDPYQQWMQFAKVGQYQPTVEDWDMIAEAARREPPMVMYSNTSRAFPVVEQFNERYGLNVEMLNLRTGDLNERLRREYDSEIRGAGVAMTGDAPVMYDQLMVNRNALTSYAPRELLAQIGEREMTPTLIHRYSIATWYYKTDSGENVPYSNLWELTTDRWRNRVAMESPLSSGTVMDFFVGVVANADEVESMYRDFFGQRIELTTPNAGYEFIKRLLENDVRILSSFRDVADAVTRADSRFAGVGTQSVYRNVVDGEYDFFLDTQVNPVVLSLRPIAMVSYTESPNTAKLLIRYVTSQEGGAPWWGADFPVNPNVVMDGPMADLGGLEAFATVWDTPIDLALRLREEISDFWVIHE